jgi:hypothetical protein
MDAGCCGTMRDMVDLCWDAIEWEKPLGLGGKVGEGWVHGG